MVRVGVKCEFFRVPVVWEKTGESVELSLSQSKIVFYNRIGVKIGNTVRKVGVKEGVSGQPTFLTSSQVMTWL